MKYLRIKEATYAGGLKVMLTFNDGVVTLIDFGAWIKENPHPQYTATLTRKSSNDFIWTKWAILHGERTETCISLLTNCMRGILCCS